jgi:hypothetical protein
MSYIPYLFKNFTKKTNFLIAKNCHNCLQYERVLNIFYFHILSIAKYFAKYTFI